MMRKWQFVISFFLVIVFVTASSMAFTDVKIIGDNVVSAYGSQNYLISYKVKNTGTLTSQNVIVVCEILDGYGQVLYTQKDFVGPLGAGQEHAGEFSYYRPDTSFLIYHRLSLEIK